MGISDARWIACEWHFVLLRVTVEHQDTTYMYASVYCARVLLSKVVSLPFIHTSMLKYDVDIGIS